MRKLTLIPSSFDRKPTNGVKRSVTPDAFSAGTTAKVISGYFVFQSCADAADAVNASIAALATSVRRLIMTPSFVVEVDGMPCGEHSGYERDTQAAAAVPRAGILESAGPCPAGIPITSLA